MSISITCLCGILIILINLHLELLVEHHDRDLLQPRNLHPERLVELRDRDLNLHPEDQVGLPQWLLGRRPTQRH